MAVLCKLLIAAVWVGAGVSKIGVHFANVIPPMVSNSPFVPTRFVRRLHYRNAPWCCCSPRTPPSRPAAIAEITIQQTIAWRSMHSQGRGLFSLLHNHAPNLDRATVREGEFACNSVTGFNSGDGHLHDESLIRALQRLAAMPLRGRRSGGGRVQISQYR